MKSINSRQNPRIKTIVALKRAKDRRTQGKFIAEGLRICATIIQAGWQPIELYATETTLQLAKKIAPEEIIIVVTTEIMQKISQATTPSGLLCVFKLPKKPKMEKLSAGIVLANISDPGNMGTLIRTTAAMGFSSVVVVDGTDPWSQKVVQATAGTIALVNIFSWSWEKLLDNKGNNQLVALVTRGGNDPEKIGSKNSLLVVGNEAHGLSKEWAAKCDKKITLPMPGRAESLNAAVAGSIALYLLSC